MISDELRAECLSYIGRTRRVRDSMAPEAAAQLAVVLGSAVSAALPPTWHWVYFNTAVASEDMGHDGHEKLGLFLPPAPFARRMWAGGDITAHRPLVVGEPAERISTIADVSFKKGKSGALCFITVQHAIKQGGTLAVSEVQTIVYRDRGFTEPSLRNASDPIPEGYRVYPDTQIQLYSGLTLNAHRIHWDRDFCRDVEGYPGLVVHGPLLATALADALFDTPTPCRFAYRAMAPVFDTSPIRVTTDGNSAQIERSDGVVAMTATLDRL